MVQRRTIRPDRWHLVFMSALMASASALPAKAADASNGATVQEVIITATKRSESLQKVPISVMALTPKILADHQVNSLDDYIKLLPSVSFQSTGPGQSQIYFRGVASAGDGLHGGSEPGTGVYIDETPVTTIANSIDMHIYDIARVEALAGPQGTLFGASSLSGTLRIITNQPDTTKFSAGYDLTGNMFTKGGPRSAGGIAEGFVNIPITDKAAIRLVGWDEHDGGYIDNTFKQRAFTLNPGENGGAPLLENNAKDVERNFNDVDTWGGRAALKVDLNDHWTITPALIYQHQKANGSYLIDPRAGDLQVHDFSAEYNADQWYQAALTIQGKIANWDVLYSGGFFQRTVDQHSDYSYYAVGYDLILGDTSRVDFPDGHGGFLDPDQRTVFHDGYTKESHEFRITSPTDYPLRAVGGWFYERQVDHVTANYVVPGLSTAADPDTSSLAVPEAGDDIFYTRLERIDRDTAFFGELSYDILSNLTLSVGGRYFTVDNSLNGFSGLISNATDPSCLPTTERGVPCINVNPNDDTNYGETHKVNLTWKIDSQRMVYATYSTGFRPGGINRTPGIPAYSPDTITNYELGWKTTWLGGRLRANGAIYDEEWKGVQFALSQPPFGITSTFNAGNARNRGIEADITARVGDHWTLSVSGEGVDAEITKPFCDFSGATPNCAINGTELPIQPKTKVNATARYDFNWNEYKNYFQIAAQDQSDTNSQLLAQDEQAEGPTKGFATFDLSAGISKDNWTLGTFVENVFDRRGILSISTNCAPVACSTLARDYPIKPRLFGVKFGQKF